MSPVPRCVFRAVASGAELGVAGLALPTLERVVNRADVLVTGSASHGSGAAGIALSVAGDVTDAHNHGDVTNAHGIGGGAAGVAGWVQGGVWTRVSNTGDITNTGGKTNLDGSVAANGDIAGLIGALSSGGQLTLSDCFSTGTLSAVTDTTTRTPVAEFDVGGLIADLWDMNDGSVVHVSACYAANTFVGGTAGRGAAIGAVEVFDTTPAQSPTMTFTHVYWNTVTGNADISTGVGYHSAHTQNGGYFDASGVIGLTPAEMQVQASFVGFDFTSTWVMPGSGLPQLQ